jgi:voltage-gated potassium channel
MEFQQPIKGRIRFALTPLALIDLLAILPFYFPLFLPIDLRFIRALRLFRLFRIFKLTRYSDALKKLGGVVILKKEELLISVMIVLVILFFASTLMYFIEGETQPETFSSVPKSLWWGVVTLTTVGYGDVYPVTPLGKVLGAVIAFLGVGMFALPAGILASGFAETIHRKREQTTCPHCGKEIE